MRQDEDKSVTQTQLAEGMKKLFGKAFRVGWWKTPAYSWSALKHDLIRHEVSKSIVKYSVNACGIVIGENFTSESFYSSRQLRRIRFFYLFSSLLVSTISLFSFSFPRSRDVWILALTKYYIFFSVKNQFSNMWKQNVSIAIWYLH